MPVTWDEHQRELSDPALCEQLPVRDYLDNVLVRTSGELVAGYELGGTISYFASDQDRERSKSMLGSLLKSIPEQSMRVQLRYELSEDLGNLLEIYGAQDHTSNRIARRLDSQRLEAWHIKAEAGYYLRPLLHAYFIWDPQLHHRVLGKESSRTARWTLSAKTAIQRARQEHEGLVAEFESLLVGIETTMRAAELRPRRLSDQELLHEIRGPNVEIWVLYVGGAPAGYFEVDARGSEVAELKYFGLVPEFQGRGLGKWLMAEAIKACWAREPRKVTV